MSADANGTIETKVLTEVSQPDDARAVSGYPAFLTRRVDTEVTVKDGETIVLSDVKHGTYKKLVVAEGRLTGAVLIGDVTDALWYLELIRSREPIARIRPDMMFGRSLALSSKAA